MTARATLLAIGLLGALHPGSAAVPSPSPYRPISSADSLITLIDFGRPAAAESTAWARLLAAGGDAGDSLAVADALDDLVEVLVAVARAARPYTDSLAERALRIRERLQGPEHHATSRSLMLRARVKMTQGAYAKSRELLDSSLAIRERALGPRSTPVAVALRHLGRLGRATGDYTAARRDLERGLDILESITPRPFRELQEHENELARLAVQSNDPVAARRHQERHIEYVEIVYGPDHPRMANALATLAAMIQGVDVEQARELSRRALAIWERNFGTDHPFLVGSLLSVANLENVTGSPDSARRLCDRALSIVELDGGRDAIQATGILNLRGMAREALGDLPGARADFERSIGIWERHIGPDNLHVALDLGNLARVMLYQGEAAQAAELFERERLVHERIAGEDHGGLVRPLRDLARARAVQVQLDTAFALALRSEAIARRNRRLMFRALSEREALSYAGHRQSGLDLALGLAADHPERGWGRAAWDAMIESRAGVLDALLARHRAARASGSARLDSLGRDVTRAGEALARLMVRGPGFEPQTYRARLDSLRAAMELAERRLADASGTGQARRDVTLGDVAHELPEGSALVAYGIDEQVPLVPLRRAPAKAGVVPPHWDLPPSRYVALILVAGTPGPVVVPLGPVAAIDSSVAAWRRALARETDRHLRLSEQEARCRALGEKVRAAVWDPVAARLGSAARVFLVPEGSLSLIDFAALPSGPDRYLVEDGPTLHELVAERDVIDAPRAPGGAGRLLAMGGPAFDHARAPGSGMLLASRKGGRGRTSAAGLAGLARFEPLPGSAQEAREVSSIWSRQTGAEAVTLVGRDASETAFKRLATGSSVVHMATHRWAMGQPSPAGTRGMGGVDFLSQPPNQARRPSRLPPPPAPSTGALSLSGLALAGANQRQASGPDGEDGVLTAEEIAILDLSGVTWAVLSGCETGLGPLAAGEGVLGLRRAFQAAGARTVIVSLWPVEDEAAREWMRALYGQRVGRSLTTADAVRGAMLEILAARRARGASTHPFYWAAFLAAGDWR